jgi:hypothetical protein
LDQEPRVVLANKFPPTEVARAGLVLMALSISLYQVVHNSVREDS